MKHLSFIVLTVLTVLAATGTAGAAKKFSKTDKFFLKTDTDLDGFISPDEWTKKKSQFKKLDKDGDGRLSYAEVRAEYGGPEKTIRLPTPKDNGGIDEIDDFTLCAIGRFKSCDMRPAVARGMIMTGLEPVFPKGLDCPGIDEIWAMSYTAKRPREAYHGGIDMPVDYGTPMLAAAAGTVVGKFTGANNARGKELVLKHGPEDTGIPLTLYTLYAHFDEMPTLNVGDRVKMGQALGPTGNSGIDPATGKQSTRRRPAIHFAVFYTNSDKFVIENDTVIPVQGWWMDPNALYRGRPPFDSKTMKALPASQKKISIPVMRQDGTPVPADTKLVWPYACK